MSRPVHFLRNYIVLLCLCLAVPLTFANLGETDDSAADDPGFREGKAAIEAQNWGKAIEVLAKTAAAFPDSADTQNFLGYAYRKSGNLDAALEHYRRALEINPGHRHAHEYIGEAYLMANDLEKAEQHLAELQKLCTPIPCEEYKELRRAVDKFKSN